MRSLMGSTVQLLRRVKVVEKKKDGQPVVRVLRVTRLILFNGPNVVAYRSIKQKSFKGAGARFAYATD
jgi:hypothetical protein